jgi:hypothetical protein
MIRRIAVPAALLLLVLGGCGQSQDDEAGSIGTAPSSSAVTSPSASALPESTPTGKPPAGPTITITGTVAAGVEPNCVLLQGETGTHLLIFPDETLRSAAPEGSKVQVTGVPKPGMMTTCQQGEPFMVSSVTPR